MNNIAIICVNYNNSNITLKLIDSIRSQIFSIKNVSAIKIFIVENSSLQDQKDCLINKYHDSSDVEILVPPKNMGYFHGLNFAINKIDASKFSHIVVGNNDLIYEENFFDILISSEYPNNAMVICPNIITKDGYHQNPHHINKLSKLQIFFFDLYFYNYLFAVILIKINRIKKYLINSSVKKIPNKVTEIYQGVGACYVLMPLFFIRNSELYFPGFLYGEEACLSHQVKKSGGKLYFDPKLLISHEESATLSKLPKIQTYKFGRDSYWKFRDILNYDD